MYAVIPVVPAMEVSQTRAVYATAAIAAKKKIRPRIASGGSALKRRPQTISRAS